MLSLLTVAGLSRAFPARDEVTSLPGWEGKLPSRHFSGYLDVGALTGVNGHLHYWLIEAETNPATAPVVLWLNGGPGSSSLIGLLTENGQFQTNDDSDASGTFKLLYNPYSWSQIANVLYLEAPKGVGFSYCDSAASCINTDESTALDNYEALVNFFKEFPEYAKNDFYITGESYAGTYIPMIMDQIQKRGGINLKGAAIGNGCWGNRVGTCAGASADARRIELETLFGNAMVDRTLHDQIIKNCANYTSVSSQCLADYAKAESGAGSYYVYHIYDQCGNDQVSGAVARKAHALQTIKIDKASESYHVHPSLLESVRARSGEGEGEGEAARATDNIPRANDYVCGAGKWMDKFLARSDVATALHVKTNTAGMTYRKTVADLRPLYRNLTESYPLLIYSGDTDACVPFLGSEEWTRLLGLPVIQAWRPWTADSLDAKNIKAGYVVNYAKNFTFLTINGAGHMVPQFRPVQSLEMLRRFINNIPF